MATTRRSPEEIHTLLEGYRQRVGTRSEYCRLHGITVHTLDYYLRRYATSKPRFARVKLTAPAAVDPTAAFTLVLRNGRRIESAWTFRDADLARLIRLAEAE